MNSKIAKYIAATMTLMLTLLAGQATAGSSASRMITDMAGRQIKVPDPLTRVALFGGPTGQIAYILGARKQLCAVTSTLRGSDLILAFDPSIQKLPAPRSTSGHVNIEELLAADAQLVIAGTFDGTIVEKKTGIPVAYTESNMNHGLDLLKREMRFYADVFQKQARAEKYIAYLEKTISFVKSRTKDIPQSERKTLFNGYGPNHLVTLGGDTFMHERIETAGCIDAAAAISSAGVKEGLHSGLAEMSMEKVLGWNPDILVIDSGDPVEVYKNPKWKSINAVQNKRVYKQPVGIFIWDRPTAEAAVLYPLWLAKTAYPERFQDVNLVKEVQRFYRETIGFNLTRSLAEAVLEGKLGIRFIGNSGRK
jgi:iron complex transport system substrate-binding protein